jgi:hypothetical protein
MPWCRSCHAWSYGSTFVVRLFTTHKFILCYFSRVGLGLTTSDSRCKVDDYEYQAKDNAGNLIVSIVQMPQHLRYSSPC